MNKCLVTGHKGYIGSRVYSRLTELGHEVKGIDLKDGNNIMGTLLDPEFVGFKPEYIFHLAAIPRVAYSMEFPYEVLYNNIVSSIAVLEYARRQGTKRVIYSSSSSVRGNGDGPTSPYGASKLVPEILCKNYSTVFDIDTVCLRYFNVYSEDQDADGPYATAVANWMKYIREGYDPFITGTGVQRRDMLHVSDAVSANMFCMNHKKAFHGAHYDVGTGDNISLNEIKDIVGNHHPNVVFEYIADRPGDVEFTKADTLPLYNLGWKTEISIKQGIESCFSN